MFGKPKAKTTSDDIFGTSEVVPPLPDVPKTIVVRSRVRIQSLLLAMRSGPDPTATACAVVHLQEARFSLGLVLRELSGGVTPYTTSERRRDFDGEGPIAPPADMPDGPPLTLPGTPVAYVDGVRKLIMGELRVLKGSLEGSYIRSHMQGVFTEKAIVSLEMAHCWMGIHYDTLRNDNG